MRGFETAAILQGGQFPLSPSDSVAQVAHRSNRHIWLAAEETTSLVMVGTCFESMKGSCDLLKNRGSNHEVVRLAVYEA